MISPQGTFSREVIGPWGRLELVGMGLHSGDKGTTTGEGYWGEAQVGGWGDWDKGKDGRAKLSAHTESKKKKESRAEKLGKHTIMIIF